MITKLWWLQMYSGVMTSANATSWKEYTTSGIQFGRMISVGILDDAICRARMKLLKVVDASTRKASVLSKISEVSSPRAMALSASWTSLGPLALHANSEYNDFSNALIGAGSLSKITARQPGWSRKQGRCSIYANRTFPPSAQHGFPLR